MKNITTKIALFFILGHFLTGCCTKEDCVVDKPRLQLKVKGSIKHFTFLILRKVDGDTFIPVIDEKYVDSVLHISYWPEYSYRDQGPFVNTLQFKVNGLVVDSINDLKFDWPSVNIPCGTCFPFGKGTTDARVIKNVSYMHKGQLFGISDTVFVDF